MVSAMVTVFRSERAALKAAQAEISKHKATGRPHTTLRIALHCVETAGARHMRRYRVMIVPSHHDRAPSLNAMLPYHL